MKPVTEIAKAAVAVAVAAAVAAAAVVADSAAGGEITGTTGTRKPSP